MNTKEKNNNIYPNITCVSGFWKVKNKHGDNYDNWFQNTLRINCPYVFFGDENSLEVVKRHRKDLPTFYIELNIEDFFTHQLKDKMITHPVHCPSVELNLIWNEKIFLIEKALEKNPFNSDFFFWIDAGICIYRDKKPPICPFSSNKIDSLPKNKFIYSSSEPYYELRVTENSYYHHISGTYILHKSMIPTFANIYRNYLDKLISKQNIWTDQVVLTHIYKDNKDLFFKLSDGYGSIAPRLYDA